MPRQQDLWRCTAPSAPPPEPEIDPRPPPPTVSNADGPRLTAPDASPVATTDDSHRTKTRGSLDQRGDLREGVALVDTAGDGVAKDGVCGENQRAPSRVDGAKASPFHARRCQAAPTANYDR